jgi:hypothetical protein
LGEKELPFCMAGVIFRSCWVLHGHTWGCC